MDYFKRQDGATKQMQGAEKSEVDCLWLSSIIFCLVMYQKEENEFKHPYFHSLGLFFFFAKSSASTVKHGGSRKNTKHFDVDLNEGTDERIFI